MKIQYGACALHDGQLGLQHTLGVCNIFGFPRQQWFRERSSMLRYTYIVCIVVVMLLDAE